MKLLMLVDNTALIGLISDREDSAQRQEVGQLVVWRSTNNQELNPLRTMESMLAGLIIISPVMTAMLSCQCSQSVTFHMKQACKLTPHPHETLHPNKVIYLNQPSALNHRSAPPCC